MRALRRMLIAAGAVAGVVALGATLLLSPGHARPAALTVHASAFPGDDWTMTSGAAANAQNALAVREDHRLVTLLGSDRPGSGPYVQSVDGIDTLVLPAGGVPYGLSDLEALGAAQANPDGDVLLVRSVLVAPNATLVINAPGTRLRLLSGTHSFTSLVGWKANLVLAGLPDHPLEISSWDPDAGAPDTSVLDGRAYIREANGSMQFSYVDASNLGFWSGRTGGVAWTGSARRAATGSIVGSAFHDNHYGVFVSRSRDLSVSASRFDHNAVDGLALHRGAFKTKVVDSSADDNGRFGFSADQGADGVTYANVVARRNAQSGIDFNGRALAAKPSASGASLRTYGGVEVQGGIFDANGTAGIRIEQASRISISRSSVSNSRDGVVLTKTGDHISVRDTAITVESRFGISVTEGSATVSGNRITSTPTAIRVRAARVDVAGNVIEHSTMHGISVTGASGGSSVHDNTIAGRGPSSLDLYRLAPGNAVRAANNDTDNWDVAHGARAYWSSFVPNHPALVLWIVVLGVPLVAALRGRRHRIPLGAQPYPDVLAATSWTSERLGLGRTSQLGRPVAAAGAST